MKLRFPACSIAAGKRVERGLTIMDMTGGGIGTANKQVYGLIKLAAKVGSDYYPEIMGNLYIVNAPFLFAGIWSMIKSFIDEKTRAKIKIIGGSFVPTMLENVDRDKLPVFLGGDCTCGGTKEAPLCMTSNAGPW